VTSCYRFHELNGVGLGGDLVLPGQEAFWGARAGTPMSEDNIWLQGRRREASALDAFITALHRHPDAGGTPEQRDAGLGASAAQHVIRGAGVTARTSPLAARTSRPGGGGARE
jgi:hypothetical protein